MKYLNYERYLLKLFKITLDKSKIKNVYENFIKTTAINKLDNNSDNEEFLS